MAKRKKKSKGFKMVELFHCLFGDSKTFLLSLLGDKAVRYKKVDNEKVSGVKGEYCPKQSGCCWDYLKTQKEETHVA